MSKKFKKAKKKFFWPPPIGSHYWWVHVDNLLSGYDYSKAICSLKQCAGLITDESEQALLAEKENHEAEAIQE